MGFLGFLKKDKKKESLNNLDLPPAPPPTHHEDDFSKQFMRPPEKKKEVPEPPLPPDAPPEMPPEFKDDMNLPPSQLRDEFHVPEMPEDIPPMSSGAITKEFAPPPTHHEVPPAPPKAVPPPPPKATPPPKEKPSEKPKQFFHGIDHTQPEVPKHPLHHPEERRRVAGGHYFRIDRFTSLVSGLNDLRSNLRRTDAVLAEITTTFQNREKDYTKWRSSLMDMKKKLMFVDKTIFKGDKQ